MLDLVIFAAVSGITIVAAILLFVLKDILHVVISLSALFFLNSLLFLFIGQPLLATIQIFVMIGGISTFLFVGAASAPYSNFKYSRMAPLMLLTIILFAILVYPISSMQFSGNASSQFNAQSIVQQLELSTPLFYVMALVMFSVCFGSIILLKRIGAIK